MNHLRTAEGWRLAIRHATTSRYEGEVFASYNEVRLTPAHTATQTVIESRIEVTPAASLHRYRDYWGTLVHTFDVHVPHTELVVVGYAEVDTSPRVPDTNAGWDAMTDRERTDDVAEFLTPTPSVTSGDELTSVAREIRANAATPHIAARDTIDCVRDRMFYERGNTTITTSATEAWEQATGVCQDFAHVTLALLRSIGVPARYVSGYLHPEPDAHVGDVAAVESHAWIEAWLGEWAGFDPVNGDPVGVRHVVVARGRDYGDVPPTRGVYTGAAAAGQDVSVVVTRVA